MAAHTKWNLINEEETCREAVQVLNLSEIHRKLVHKLIFGFIELNL